jgi:hypothetical protein
MKLMKKMKMKKLMLKMLNLFKAKNNYNILINIKYLKNS